MTDAEDLKIQDEIIDYIDTLTDNQIATVIASRLAHGYAECGADAIFDLIMGGSTAYEGRSRRSLEEEMIEMYMGDTAEVIQHDVNLFC